jgi:hypothetical protein
VLSKTGLMLIVVASVGTGAALAQTAATSPSSPPAAGAPVAGANSFTEAQARKRIEDQGFTNVTNLKKDDQSIWRGTAMKGGTSVSVALDFQGNVVSN